MPSQKIETGHEDTVHDVAMDYYGKRIATASSDHSIKIVGVNNNSSQHLANLTGHQGPVWQVAWAHPKFGSLLASCSYDGRVIIWKEGNQNDWIQAHVFDDHKSSVNSIAWAPHELGLCLACGSSDGNISVFTARADGNWDTSRIDQAHPAGVTSVSWAPSTAPGALVGSGLLDPAQKLCSGGCDNTVKVWKLYNGNWKLDCFPALNMHADWVRDVAWAPNLGLPKSTIASASQDGKVIFSPWDRHEGCYGKTLEYNEFYLGQMTELLTRYGEIKEVWLDGAKGEGEKDMEYFFDSWFSLIHQHQPGAIIFSDAGPDTRWIGDEAGVAGSTCWSLFNRSSAQIGNTDPIYSQGGDPSGHDWVPAECDVSIRPGWFWHASEVPKSAIKLLDIYYKSVGRNCLLLLNVPPNSSGLISDEDIQVLKEFSELRRSIFSDNLAGNAILNASSTRGSIGDSRFDPYNIFKEGIYTYWAPEENVSDWALHLNLQESVSFNVLQVQEPIYMGQRIMAFHLEVLNEDGDWRMVINGTTVGYQRLLHFPNVESQHLKFVIDKSRADPLISYLGIYMDQFSIVNSAFHRSSPANINSSQVLWQAIHNHSTTASI